MNFLRKALASDTKIPKTSHGQTFTNKERQYYELERILRKLVEDVKRYAKIWGELLSCKTSIYGYLLYFYNQKSEKRTIIDDLFKFHTRPMEKYINKLTKEYQNNLIDEIQQILKIFPDTRQMISTLSLKKQQYLSKKQYYQQLKQSTGKMDYKELSEIDEQVRIFEHTYDFSVRTVIREFEQKVDHKDRILDRFCIRMLESDSKLYSHLFKTSQILRDKSLMFQYYRDYPTGLPSYFRDYSYQQDIQDSSDSDINASKSNIFYENTIKKNSNEQLINQLTKHGFEYERVQTLIKKHPNLTYEQLLETLNNENNNDESTRVSDIIAITQQLKEFSDDDIVSPGSITTENEPPPPQNVHRKPKAPHKSNIENEKPALDTNIIPQNNKNDEASESMPELITSDSPRYRRSHSKSVSSHDIYISHRTPPPPPRSHHSEKNMDRKYKRSLTVDLTTISKPKPPPISPKMTVRKEKSLSTTPEIPDLHTAVVASTMDIDTMIENKETDDDINEDEWPMPSPHIHEQSPSDNFLNTGSKSISEYTLNPKTSTSISSVSNSVSATKKNVKKPLSTNYIQIKQLLKKDNGVRPWVWNKKDIGHEALYRYSRTNKLEEDNKHPLGCGLHTMLNFRHMHQLFHPRQTRNIGDTNSNVMPNKINIKDTVVRNVNVRKLALDVSKLDPKVQSWIYSKGKPKDIIQNIPKPGNVQSGNVMLDKLRNVPVQQRKGNKPPPNKLKNDTPPPPGSLSPNGNIND